MNIERRNFPSELRVAASGKLRGYAALFGSLSEDLGGFREKIAPGAFKDAVKSSDTRALWNHDSNYVLGRKGAGTLRLGEDTRGLWIEVDPPDTTWAQDLRKSILRGDVHQMSFGFRLAKGGDTWEDRDGQQLRTITRVAELVDVSPVTFPAYNETSISVRSTKNMRLPEMKEERQRVWRQMCELNDTENWNTEQKSEYERLESTIDELDKKISHEERARAERKRDLDERRKTLGTDGNYYAANRPGRNDGSRGAEEIRQLLPEHLRDVWKINPVRSNPEHVENFDRLLTHPAHAAALNTEQRAVYMDADVQGGYLIAPEIFVADIIKGVDDETFALRETKVIPADGAHQVGIPALGHDPADADWTSELAAGQEDDTMDFQKRRLFPAPLAKRIKVSNEIVRSDFGAAFVRQRLSYKGAITLEKAFFEGNGVNQPLGLFTASDSGISTAQDVSTHNTATGITADNLIECCFSLKGQYLRRARWMFHRDAMKRIRKLKDGEGLYLFAPSDDGAYPGKILGVPVLISEYVPNTFSAGSYVGILGDFSYFWWAIAYRFEIKVADQLYLENNQTGYFLRMKADGQPMLEEAFCRVTLGT